MLPYDGVPEEAAQPAASYSSTRLNAATARATTSAWQWDAQWGLYFNCETKQWAKPLPDGTWEYADAVRTTDDDLPRRKKKPRRRMDRDDPEQEDEKFDPFAVPEEQIWPGTDNDDDDDDEDDERTTTGDPYANAPLLRLVVADPRPDPTVLPPAYKVASIDPGEPVSIGRDKSYERRIRLRELAVSKSHATLFWTVVDPDPDSETQGMASEGQGYWAIVDNASTHGTLVRAAGEKRFVRLSEPKVASVPHRLYHLEYVLHFLLLPPFLFQALLLTFLARAARSASVRPLSRSTSTPLSPAQSAPSRPTRPTSSPSWRPIPPRRRTIPPSS